VSVTGAFHEDALADAIDGFGGGWDAEHVLAIMKDSRVGSYALIGMILAIAVKAAALVAIADAAAENRLAAVTRALIAAHVLARWSSVILIARWSYVRAATPGGRAPAGTPFVDMSTPARASLATVIAWAGVAIALRWRAPALAAVGVATVVTVLGGRYAGHRIGGITGDVLGAVNQLVELVTYLVLAAHPWQ
jgi:adenosylcobinamide-GDP ribazoletransferase